MKDDALLQKSISRTVLVDPQISPQAALSAAGFKEFATDYVLAAAPRGLVGMVTLEFFQLDQPVNQAELDHEYQLRGLVPADLFSVAALHAIEPSFSDTCSTCTSWVDSYDKRCWALWYNLFGERQVLVHQVGRASEKDRQFAGVHIS